MNTQHLLVIDWANTCEWHHEWERCRVCGELARPDENEGNHLHHVGLCRRVRAIVIPTWPGAREPLTLLLASLDGCGYPVVIVMSTIGECDAEWLAMLSSKYQVLGWPDARYELGAISAVMERTDYEEFLLLQDTFEVIDQSFIDACFDRPESVALGPTFFHYAGKWKRNVLAQMDIPEVRTKAESIHWEHTFSRLYWEREAVWVFDPHFHDGENQGFVEAFGRKNMLLENSFYRKRKGTWA